MTVPRFPPFCPVLIDIGSSRAVTLPYFHQEVYPSLLTELRGIAANKRVPPPQYHRLQSVPTAGSPTAVLESWVRPCGFSTEQPLLQHESWNVPWQTYMDSVRQRGRRVSSASGVSVGCGEVDTPSLFGPASVPVSVCLPDTPAKKERDEDKEEEDLTGCDSSAPSLAQQRARRTIIMMNFFRVDAFIPIHVQMYHVMRRLMDFGNVAAVAVVVPAHHTEYFIETARRMPEGVMTSSCSVCGVPKILVYNPKGLQFQSP